MFMFLIIWRRNNQLQVLGYKNVNISTEIKNDGDYIVHTASLLPVKTSNIR